jgi:single-strand DNA-binding protein
MAASEPTVTIIGNVTANPELRFTPNGQAVASFTVASTPRYFDKTKNDWVEGAPVFMRCNIWRSPAENVRESIYKGNRVIVLGRLQSKNWETKDGEKRSSIECEVDEVALSVRFTTAQVIKADPADTPVPEDDKRRGVRVRR